MKRFSRILLERIDALAEAINPNFAGVEWEPLVRAAMQCGLSPHEAENIMEKGARLYFMHGETLQAKLNEEAEA